MTSQVVVKCRFCRNKLLSCSFSQLLTGHSSSVDELHSILCSDSDCRDTVDSLYIQEDSLPAWMASSIDEACWEKGKLKCPHCSARLGSFDFVSGRKCQCGKCILPPVHLIKGKIDCSLP